ncbi:MAG TPA: hypothetical protein VLF90_00735 [Patescibacteria group bacterium]|nr:hypothetical protein [Patescibacteria group bacterium]
MADLRPSERIAKYHREEALRQANREPFRQQVLQAVGRVVIDFTGGCTVNNEIKTRTPGKSHWITTALYHDAGAYEVRRQSAWATGGVDDVSWTFDADLIDPIVDVHSFTPNFDKLRAQTWNELHTAVHGLAVKILGQEYAVAMTPVRVET